MNTALTPTAATSIERIVRLVTDAVTSPHTQRAYARALDDFIAWYRGQGERRLNKETIKNRGQPCSVNGRD